MTDHNSTAHPWRIPPYDPIHDPVRSQTCADFDRVTDEQIAGLQEMLRERDRLWDGISESPEEVVERLVQAEAAIARVRQLCVPGGGSFWLNDTDSLSGRALTVAQVLAALDGAE